MVTKRNNAAGGTDGVTLTAANSGGASGDAWDIFGGTVDPQFSTVHPSSGTKSIKYPAGSGQSSFHRWTSFPGTETLEVRFFVWVVEWPNPSTEILQLRSASARAASVYITNTGFLNLQDAAQASIWTSTATLPVGAGYQVRVWVKRGTTTSNGQTQIDYYNAAGTLVQSSGVLTGKNTGTAVPVEVRAGKTSSSTWVSTDKLYTDDWQATDSSSAGPTLGVYPVAAPVSKGTLSYSPLIDVRASTGGGTLTHTISPSTGTSQPTPGLFLVPAVTTSTPVDYTVTTTDASSGLSATSTYEVTEQAGTVAVDIVVLQVDGVTWV